MVSLDAYVFDTLMRDLVGHDRQPSAFLLYLYLWHETYGKSRKRVRISLQSLATASGLSKRSVQNAIRVLKRRRLLSMQQASATATPVYELARPWRA